MKNILKISLSLSLFSTSFILCQTENNPLFNPLAEANFKEKLAIGEKAVAVDQTKNIFLVKIVQEKNNLILTAPFDVTDWELKNKPSVLKWFKSNSVYKFYDIRTFNQTCGKYKSAVESNLLCLCQKYNIKLDIVTGKTSWPTYYLKDSNEKAEIKQNLKELWDKLEPQTDLPNTFLPYENNPAIWRLIAKERNEFVECLSKVSDPNKTRLVDFYLKEIEKAKLSATSFNGGTEGLYTSTTHDWMLRSVSLKARSQFIQTQKGWNSDKESVNKINTALDNLKPICMQKIPFLKLPDYYFKYQDVSTENVMKSHLSNPTSLKIIKSGVTDANWIVEKNNLGVPLYQYKRGQMWVKNSADDHGLCKVLFFEIRQNYKGSGSYSNSVINGYHEELCGCQ